MIKRQLPQRQFGKTGRKLSVIGFGAYHLMYLDRPTSRLLLNRALDEGVTFIDTGSMYGDSEEKIGEVLRTRREECFVSTKVAITTRVSMAISVPRYRKSSGTN